MAGPGGHWLGLDVPSTGTVCGAIGDATGTHGELWYTRDVVTTMLAIINIRLYILSAPTRAPTPIYTRVIKYIKTYH